MLVGETSFCFAQAHYTDGSAATVAPNWSSNDPSIASFGNSGNLTGRAAGQVVVTAQYGGQSGSAHVSVQAEDVVAVTSSGLQGTFQVGKTVTMTAIGHYGVASADTAQLSIEITNQDGTLIVAGTPQNVSRGGDTFVLSITFTIPAGTTQVCRTAVLQIGAVRLTDAGPADIFPCVAVG